MLDFVCATIGAGLVNSAEYDCVDAIKAAFAAPADVGFIDARVAVIRPLPPLVVAKLLLPPPLAKLLLPPPPPPPPPPPKFVGVTEAECDLGMTDRRSEIGPYFPTLPPL